MCVYFSESVETCVYVQVYVYMHTCMYMKNSNAGDIIHMYVYSYIHRKAIGCQRELRHASPLDTTSPNAIRHNTIRHKTIQHNAIRHNTIRHHTILHNTIEHTTAHHSTI